MVAAADVRNTHNRALRQRNPLSTEYMGQAAHHALAHSEAGDRFFTVGAPTQKAMDRVREPVSVHTTLWVVPSLRAALLACSPGGRRIETVLRRRFQAN